MKPTILLSIVLFIVFACSKESEPIVNPADYKGSLSLLPNASDMRKREEMLFWKKRFETLGDETSLIKMAALFAENFKSSGQITDILHSDSLYKVVLQKNPVDVSIYHALASNAITQHQFKTALDFTEKALAIGDKKSTSLMIMADVSLELGNYPGAIRILNDFTNKKSFAYLIRAAKVKDHEGKSDSAIWMMEKAYERISGNKALACWTLTNLGDMYGHAGRIQDAYQTYLKVLKINPADDYALKGIAWIALAHDHNLTEAKKIIHELAARKRLPEAHLMLAEAADIEGNETEKEKQLQEFKAMTSGTDYKTMYHKYLASIEAEDFKNPDACVAIAKEEIENRPTPQSYDLLAWGYFNQGNHREALQIAESKVEGQTYEPDTFYHLGVIYLANGKRDKAKHYLELAYESEFELGPSTTSKIQEALKKI